MTNHLFLIARFSTRLSNEERRSLRPDHFPMPPPLLLQWGSILKREEEELLVRAAAEERRIFREGGARKLPTQIQDDKQCWTETIPVPFGTWTILHVNFTSLGAIKLYKHSRLCLLARHWRFSHLMETVFEGGKKKGAEEAGKIAAVKGGRRRPSSVV